METMHSILATFSEGEEEGEGEGEGIGALRAIAMVVALLEEPDASITGGAREGALLAVRESLHFVPGRIHKKVNRRRRKMNMTLYV